MELERAAAVLAPYAGHLDGRTELVARDLEAFAALVLKWNVAQNLVSRETVKDLWPRHIADSLQILRLLKMDDNFILDLGSGGGFPAIPLAIALKTSGTRFVLVEPIVKKAAFLRTVIRDLHLQARVENKRSEDIDSRETGPADVITSRALAPLVDLCRMALPFFGPQTRAIFHKGGEHVDELTQSLSVWRHDVLITKSATNARGVLLELTNLSLRNK